MTEAERETVARNLGLVGMQIKRLLGQGVADAHVPEYREELFQEGCLGLMQAVRSYDSSSGMSFATYALPRIHYAAWRALRRYRETIRLPERYGRTKGESADDADGGCRAGATDPNPLRVRSCTPEEMDSLTARSARRRGPNGRPEAMVQPGCATVGGVLRRKLEAAVDAAVQVLTATTRSRSDRSALARALADQRLLVPEAGFQASLREIARTTRSSYGRVAACEGLLVAEVRRLLAADVEFGLLRQAGARRRDGMAAVIDDGLRDALREGATARLIAVFACLPRAGRADVLLTVLEKAGVDVAALLRTHVSDLSDSDRSRLLETLRRRTSPRRRCRAPTRSAAVAEAR